MTQLNNALKRSNQVKRGYTKIKELIENVPLLTKNECIDALKYRYHTFLGKGGSRKLIKENPSLYKSIMKYGKEYDKFLKTSKPFSLYLILCGRYQYNVPEECFCKGCKTVINWRPAIQEIITNWTCRECFPAPNSKNYFKLKYGNEWEVKREEYINNPITKEKRKESGRKAIQSKLDRQIATFINKGKREEQILNDVETHLKIKIARNYKIAGFYPDGYCEDTNTIYEVYEPFHIYQKNKDNIRKIIIQNRLKCKFVIIHDDGVSKTCDLPMESFEYIPNNIEAKIQTNNGLKNFKGILKQTKKCISITTETTSLTGTLTHRIKCLKEFRKLNELTLGDRILVNNIPENILYIKDEGNREVYDIVDVEDTNSYITNGITSHNCVFLDNGESTVSQEMYDRLKAFVRDPIYVMDDGCYKIFEEPKDDKIYVAGVDVSEGVGGDYSVINIFDMTDLTSIKQVAVYANNDITPHMFTKKVDEVLTQWGKPLVCIERNNQGGQVVDNLRNIYHYENIVSWGASEAGRTKSQLGIISHTNTKQKGVTNMRYWVNTLRSVEFRDINILKELKDFIRYPNGTWAAKKGANYHDDLVMSMVWALIVLEDSIVQKYFEVVKLDDNKRPLEIKALDYGIKYNVMSNSMYNENDYQNGGMPIVINGYIENSNEDLQMLQNQGWKPLQ